MSTPRRLAIGRGASRAGAAALVHAAAFRLSVPSHGADVARREPGPAVQMWQGMSPVAVQVWPGVSVAGSAFCIDSASR